MKYFLTFLTVTIFLSSFAAQKQQADANQSLNCEFSQEQLVTPANFDSQKTYKELTRSEKRAFRKDVKSVLRNYEAPFSSDESKNQGGGNFVIALILCFLIPPLGVYIYEGAITSNFWISLLLTLFFFLPGVIYSLLVVTGTI